MIKYLLDVNVGENLRKGLRARYPDMVVWRMGEPTTPPIDTQDPDILLWCEAHDFTLVTNNRGSMPDHLRDHLAAGHHFPGMLILNPKMSLADTIETLALIWGVARPDEYADQITYLPLR